MNNDKIREAVEWSKDPMVCINFEQPHLKTVFDLAEHYLEVSAEMPEVRYAHTYASENADLYESHDRGQQEMLDRCTLATTKMLAKKNAEIAKLKEENKELLAWRDGKKGVEEYYELKAEVERLKKEQPN